jgi:pimeloyl-ACP methyl ester carboxylesterase
MVARRHLLGVSLILSLLALGVGASSAAALKFTSCSQSSDFRCATLAVPLDHSGKTAGQLRLKVAAQRRYPRGAGILIALAGGPGQAGVPLADQFAAGIAPMLRRYRLVVLDQRGTGASGALSCPELQAVTDADLWSPSLIGDCAQLIGPSRRFYSTLDSAADIDAVRRAFGARKVALMGISYGTWVAQQYARRHPNQTDSLILDSVVGPQQPSGFYLDTLAAIPRVTADQCAGKRCEGITRDPVGDLSAVVSRAGNGPLSGTIYNSNGRPATAEYSTAAEILSLIGMGDVNSELQAQLPAAMAAARKKDYAQLLRLLPMLAGAPMKTRQLSLALNVVTSCLDSALPYQLSSAIPARPPLMSAALAAIPPANYAPFDAATVGAESAVSDCLRFPSQPDTAPVSGGLPNVPALVLAGQLDLRTPAENASAVAALLPKAALVELRGAGHDLLDSDTTGCVATALARFAARQKVGSPCAKRDNAIRPVQVAPRGVADAAPLPGTAGTRGRAFAVALASVEDAISVAYMKLNAGAQARSGGLRGGSFDARSGPVGQLVLASYRYAGDLAATGRLRLFSSGPRGTITISGAASGTVTIESWNSASATIDGRAIKWNRAEGASSRRPAARSTTAVLR